MVLRKLSSTQASRDLLISNQVAKGFEQLSSDKLVVRLGGIYALEGVMNTSEQYHQPVLGNGRRSARNRYPSRASAPLTGETSFRDDRLLNDGILPLHYVHRSDRRRVD